MSDLGTIMDALITEARSGVTSIPALALGAERGVRVGEELSTAELPHLFVHSPEESVDLLDFQQEQRTCTFTLDLWADDTQEALLLKLDAIRDKIALNRSLSSAVDYATVTGRQVFEFAGKDRKVGRLVVSTVKVA
jgi:hypothetical protein